MFQQLKNSWTAWRDGNRPIRLDRLPCGCGVVLTLGGEEIDRYGTPCDAHNKERQ